MFERYTEKARRVIFYGRLFASEFGCDFIEPEHILLAIVREDPELLEPWIKSGEAMDSFRAEVEACAKGSNRVSDSVDMALSQSAKRVLAHAAEESDRLKDRDIRPSHLLAGLLRERDTPAAAALRRSGIELQQARVVFIASSDGQAALHAETGDLHRLIDELPPSQLGRARALLVALREAARQSPNAR